jgi:hypothetical protein
MLCRASDFDGFFGTNRKLKIDVKFGAWIVKGLYRAGAEC